MTENSEILSSLNEIEHKMKAQIQKIQRFKAPIKYREFQPKSLTTSTQTPPHAEESPTARHQREEEYKKNLQKIVDQIKSELSGSLIKKHKLPMDSIAESPDRKGWGEKKKLPTKSLESESISRDNNTQSVESATTFEKKIQKFEQTNKNLEKGIEEFHIQCQRLTNLCSEKQSQVLRLEQRIKSLQEKESESERMLDLLTKDSQELSFKLREVQRQLQYKNSRCYHLQHENSNLLLSIEYKDSQIEDLARQLSSTEKQHKQNLFELNLLQSITNVYSDRLGRVTVGNQQQPGDALEIINLKVMGEITETVQRLLENEQHHHEADLEIKQKLCEEQVKLCEQRNKHEIEEIKRFNDFTKRYFEGRLKEEAERLQRRHREEMFVTLEKSEEIHNSLKQELQEEKEFWEEELQVQREQMKAEFQQRLLNEADKAAPFKKKPSDQEEKAQQYAITTKEPPALTKNRSCDLSFENAPHGQAQTLSERLESAELKIEELEAVNSFREKEISILRSKLHVERQSDKRRSSGSPNSVRFPSFAREGNGDDDTAKSIRERDAVTSNCTATFYRSSIASTVRQSAHFKSEPQDQKEILSEKETLPQQGTAKKVPSEEISPPDEANDLGRIEERESEEKASEEYLRASQISKDRFSGFDQSQTPASKKERAFDSPSKGQKNPTEREKSECIHKNYEKTTKNARLRAENKALVEQNKHLNIELQQATQYILTFKNLGSIWRRKEKEKDKLSKLEQHLMYSDKLNELVRRKNKIQEREQQQNSSDSSSTSNINKSSRQIGELFEELDQIVQQTSHWVAIFDRINKKEVQKQIEKLNIKKANKKRILGTNDKVQLQSSELACSLKFEKEKTIYSEGDEPRDPADIDHLELSPFEFEPQGKHHEGLDDEENFKNLFQEGKEISEISSVKNQSQVSDFLNSRSELVNIFDPKPLTIRPPEEEAHPNVTYALQDMESHSHLNEGNQTVSGSRQKEHKTKSIHFEDYSNKSLREVCTKEKQKVRSLEKKITEMRTYYIKSIERVNEENRKKMTKLQRDFDRAMNTIISARHQNPEIYKISTDPNVVGSDFNPNAVSAVEKTSKNITRSMSEINLPSKINEKDEIDEEKIEELQAKVEDQENKIENLETEIKEKGQGAAELEKKLKHERFLNEKLQTKLKDQKEKTNSLKLLNKRLKNEFNQFMDKLGHQAPAVQLNRVEFLKKTSNDSFTEAGRLFVEDGSQTDRGKAEPTERPDSTRNSYAELIGLTEDLMRYVEKNSLVSEAAPLSKVNSIEQIIELKEYFKSVLQKAVDSRGELARLLLRVSQDRQIVEELGVQISAKQQRINQNQDRIKDLQWQITEKEQSLQKVSSRLESLQSQAKTLREQKLTDFQTISVLQQKVQQKDSKIKQLSSTLSDSSNSHNQSEERIDNLLTDLETARNQIVDLQQSLSSKLILVENLYQKVRDLESENSGLLKQTQLLKRDIEAMDKSIKRERTEDEEKPAKKESPQSLKRKSTGSLGSMGHDGEKYYEFEEQALFNNVSVLEEKDAKIAELTQELSECQKKCQKLQEEQKKGSSSKKSRIYFYDR